MDVLLILIGVGVPLLLALALLAVPIIALVRTFQLSSRLGRLEDELHKLRHLLRGRPEPAETREAIAEEPPPPPIPVVEPVREELVPMQLVEEHAVSGVEALIGGRALGWIAVVLLLVAGAFFLRVIFERGLIGPLGRVGIGLAVSLALCAAGYVFHRRGWRVFSEMLTSGGVVLLYLVTFATFGFFDPPLLAQRHAGIFLVAVIVEALALAVLYESPTIALMGVIGGLMTPLLLATQVDHYLELFAYLALLDLGIVMLVLFRDWWASATVALVGTHAIFWGWYAANYHPAKWPIALGFVAVVFLLFLAHTILGQLVRGRRAGIEALVRLVLNAAMFAAAGYVLLDTKELASWASTGAVGLAIVYACLAWATVAGRRDDVRLLAVTIATAMGLIAMVFPLEAEAAWIAVGWAAQGLVLWGFGLRIRSLAVRVMGAAFLALAAGRLLFVDTFAGGPKHAWPFVPLFNSYGTPAIGVVAAIVAASALSYLYRPRRLSLDFVAMRLLSVAGFLLLWMVLSIEVFDYFREFEGRMSQTALSVLWALYAVATLLVGFRFGSRPLRWLALGVFALTLGKVVLIDTAALEGFYRVTAYLVLAVVMGAAAWSYQKVKRALSVPAVEENR